MRIIVAELVSSIDRPSSDLAIDDSEKTTFVCQSCYTITRVFMSKNTFTDPVRESEHAK